MQARSEGLWPRATEAHAIRTLLGIATLWRVKRSEQTRTACSRFELIIRVALELYYPRARALTEVRARYLAERVVPRKAKTTSTRK